MSVSLVTTVAAGEGDGGGEGAGVGDTCVLLLGRTSGGGCVSGGWFVGVAGGGVGGPPASDRSPPPLTGLLLPSAFPLKSGAGPPPSPPLLGALSRAMSTAKQATAASATAPPLRKRRCDALLLYLQPWGSGVGGCVGRPRATNILCHQHVQTAPPPMLDNPICSIALLTTTPGVAPSSPCLLPDLAPMSC
jgi:hypothetical protein